MLLVIVVVVVSGLGSLVARSRSLWYSDPQAGSATAGHGKDSSDVSVKPTYRVEIQLHDGKDRQLQRRDSPMDTCRIMSQCFSHSKVFGNIASCQDGIDRTIKYYDSGFLVESRPGQHDEIVGFLSALPVRRQKSIFIIIYNVCIDTSRRRQGLARKLIIEFIEKYVAMTSWPRNKIYIALDVDLRAPLAAGALSLYLKLGFVRCLQPCKNVYENDVSKVINSPRKPEADGTLQRILADPKEYAHSQYGSFHQQAAQPHPSHFCMYKRLEDAFDYKIKENTDVIGTELAAAVAELDRKSPQHVEVVE